MADSAKAAKQQLAKVELRYKLRIQSFEKKRDWLYKVFVAGKKPASGRQSAYSKEEVANALRNVYQALCHYAAG